MDRTRTGGWRSPALRGLEDPVRTVGEALEDVVRDLLIEFLNPATTRRRQVWIGDRLVAVRSIAGEQNYTTLVQRIMASLLS